MRETPRPLLVNPRQGPAAPLPRWRSLQWAHWGEGGQWASASKAPGPKTLACVPGQMAA